MSKNEKKSLYGSLHVFDHKKRTNNNWNTVEPILELENIDQSRKMVVVAHSFQFCNTGPLFPTVTFNDDLKLPIEKPRFNSILRV